MRGEALKYLKPKKQLKEINLKLIKSEKHELENFLETLFLFTSLRKIIYKKVGVFE
jgi:hypothetical protein